MIATEQSLAVRAPLDKVWDYASDITRWANLMPGLVEFEILGPDDSRWTLKVGAGALVRTVRVAVHVDGWAGPEQVDFSYRLEGDPVEGGGTYTARSLGPAETEIGLAVRVAGKGPQAPMWEAIGRPLLPSFARAFAEQLKDEIERANPPAIAPPAAAAATSPPRSLLVRMLSWLLRMLRRRNRTVARHQELS